MPRQAQPSPVVLSAPVTVNNARGLHMRCACELAMLAAAFSSRISISKGKRQVDAKSMLDIVTLSASPGSKLTVSASGSDAQTALEAMVAYFAEKLGGS
jgi:phosphocarrier protein